MQRYSVVTGAKPGTAQSVLKCYCKSCKQPAMVAVLENKSIEDKVKEHTEKINQKIKAIESNLHKKAESTELEKLQKRVEELENRMKKVQTIAKEVDHGQI